MLIKTILGQEVDLYTASVIELTVFILPALKAAKEDFKYHSVSGELYLTMFIFLCLDSIYFCNIVGIIACVILGILSYGPWEPECFGSADWILLAYPVCFFCKIPWRVELVSIGFYSLAVGISVWLVANRIIYKGKPGRYIAALPALPICDIIGIAMIQLVCG